MLIETGGVKLNELHILYGDTNPIDNAQSIAGIGMGIGGYLVSPPITPGSKHHRFAVEEVELPTEDIESH